MQVLVKNHYAPCQLPLSQVVPSFWLEACLYPTGTFSMSSMMDPRDLLGLSPFLVLDAKVAFAISQLSPSALLYGKNLGPLGTLAAHLLSGCQLLPQEHPQKFARYLKEYLPPDEQQIFSDSRAFDQVISLGENKLDLELWRELPVGGLYLMGGEKLELELAGGDFEALGKLWPYGEATEFGWQFHEESLGLDNFHFCKLKKLR
jgi:hypothetical protein